MGGPVAASGETAAYGIPEGTCGPLLAAPDDRLPNLLRANPLLAPRYKKRTVATALLHAEGFAGALSTGSTPPTRVFVGDSMFERMTYLFDGRFAARLGAPHAVGSVLPHPAASW